MSEMKPTPGPWTQGTSRNGMECVWLDGETEPAHRMGPVQSWIDCGTAANARLIAEAGTVFHNTGLSPVQLVEMVKELKAASKHCEDLLWRYEINRVNGEELADAALAMLRAALAKCEGVK